MGNTSLTPEQFKRAHQRVAEALHAEGIPSGSVQIKWAVPENAKPEDYGFADKKLSDAKTMGLECDFGFLWINCTF